MLAMNNRAGINNSKRITEVAIRIGKHPQHSHVDTHDVTVRDWAAASQVALRSSDPIASRTATRVSGEPEIAFSVTPLRSNWRSRFWSYSAGSVESMKCSRTSTNRSG